ncbi:DUF3995 domain-containing protein [Fibrella aquatilis]|uniref:DUF3995 domain-containing protein n=1 Tax=Fibrella aquatilis TaxID=2817059 RepID=A0A939GBS7_9BACT|nr:DUF3995 domain-containing protein [Fibrella aquatilis]MBO0934334.1 DUF3995 domain-containing protein [Fibrella aquatilis]
MLATTALINTVILLAISGLHVYWAVGGKWGMAVATPELPQKSGEKAFTPGPLITLVVAAGLALFAVLHLAKLGWLPLPLSEKWLRYGLLAVGGIFFLRVIGDFRYVGFFKHVTDTAFAKMDTAYYVPLCLVISINAFWTAVG